MSRSMENPAPGEAVRLCHAANDLWLSFCSGLTLSCLRTHGQKAIGELEFGSLRRHQLKHFRDGLQKLGLLEEPSDAIRCAKYHFFSNSLGGRRMDYFEESPSKVWILYRPPFWICDGTGAPMASIAALGSAIGQGAFRAWHANNGSLLGNPRLAFVQTHSQTDGDAWEAGYFKEFPEDLPADQTYQRRPGEPMPWFEKAAAPALPHTQWPEERTARALRNFAVGHTVSRMVVLTEMFGIVGAAAIVEHAFRTVLIARWRWLIETLGSEIPQTPGAAAKLFANTASLIDDEIEIEERGEQALVRLKTARMWRGEPVRLPEIDEAIVRAWSAALPLYRRGLSARLVHPTTEKDPGAEILFDLSD